jgi:hypothetical protein
LCALAIARFGGSPAADSSAMLEIDLPLGVDDADHRPAEIDYVENKLGRESHVGINE